MSGMYTRKPSLLIFIPPPGEDEVKRIKRKKAVSILHLDRPNTPYNPPVSVDVTSSGVLHGVFMSSDSLLSMAAQYFEQRFPGWKSHPETLVDSFRAEGFAEVTMAKTIADQIGTTQVSRTVVDALSNGKGRDSGSDEISFSIPGYGFVTTSRGEIISHSDKPNHSVLSMLDAARGLGEKQILLNQIQAKAI